MNIPDISTIEKDRAERIKKTAEIFTPPHLVNEILDKLEEYKEETWKEGETVLDPACGDGNFLVEALKRKIEYIKNNEKALKDIFGADIMMDNIIMARKRLLDIAGITKNNVAMVLKNIKWTGDLKNGSLDYNFAFDDEYVEKDVNEWYEYFKGAND